MYEEERKRKKRKETPRCCEQTLMFFQGPTEESKVSRDQLSPFLTAASVGHVTVEKKNTYMFSFQIRIFVRI